MIDIISNLISASYENPGSVQTQPRVLASLVESKRSADPNNVNIESNEGQIFNTEQLRGALKDYSLTTLMIDIVSSTVEDIIAKSSFEVTVKDKDSKYNEEVNNYLSKVRLKTLILESLDEALYNGTHAWYVEKNSNTKKYKSRELLHPANIVLSKKRGEPFKYLSESADKKTVSFDANKVIYLAFDATSYKKVSLNKTSDENAALVDISYHQGRGLLDSIFPLLFEHMIKYLMKLLLSIKDTIRPDVLIAQMADKNTDVPATTEAIQNIEALLNNGENSFDVRASDPATVINVIQNAILNSLKVVPGLQNFNSFELLQYPDLATKLSKLDEDLSKLKESISNQVGIPAELTEGTSNRWEIISRSSRFLTLVETRLNSISQCVAEAVRQFLMTEKNEMIDIEDISINLDTTNILFNQSFNNKSQVISDKVSAVQTLISNADSIKESGSVDIEKFDDWFNNQIKSLDPTLADVLINKQKTESADSNKTEGVDPEVVETTTPRRR